MDDDLSKEEEVPSLGYSFYRWIDQRRRLTATYSERYCFPISIARLTHNISFVFMLP
jgi:hypothetical protein